MKVRVNLRSPDVVKHQSIAYDKLRRRSMDAKICDKVEAAQWCKENNCRGYQAVSKGIVQGIDPRTINVVLDEKVEPRKQREYCSILTSDEETVLVRYLKNRVRCLQGLNMKETEALVLNILKVRRDVNRRGGRAHIKLSTNAQSALLKNKVSRSFFSCLRTEYPELKLTPLKKVDMNRGLNNMREMAEEYLDDLAAEINHAGIGILKHISPGEWIGEIDCLRIICHDETPQFINHGTSNFMQGKVFGVRGQNTETLTKSNREWCLRKDAQ